MIEMMNIDAPICISQELELLSVFWITPSCISFSLHPSVSLPSHISIVRSQSPTLYVSTSLSMNYGYLILSLHHLSVCLQVTPFECSNSKVLHAVLSPSNGTFNRFFSVVHGHDSYM